MSYNVNVITSDCCILYIYYYIIQCYYYDAY